MSAITDAASVPPTRHRRGHRALRIVAWIAAILAILFLVLQFALGSIVKRAATAAGPAFLGTDISISQLHARIFSGKIGVEGLVVGPPEGFDANLFEMEHFKVELDAASLLRSDGPIVIREIVIRDPLVSYELKGLHDNLHALLKKLGADTDEEEDEDTSEGRKVVIEHFLFEGGRVRVAVANGKGAIVPLPTIELHGIGSKNGGITGLEATVQILKSITVGTVKAAAGVVTDLGGAAADGAKAAAAGVMSVGKAIGDLFDGDSDTPESPEP